MLSAAQNQTIELSFRTDKAYANPFRDVAIKAVITGPDHAVQSAPGFWAGDGVWKVRYASPTTGEFAYRIVCTDPDNAELHGRAGHFRITPYAGDNPLYKHGPIRKSADSRYLEHQDGKPFFWLGDTWWMGLAARLEWPESFETLVRDRVEKGFSVIQIIAGLYPDMDPFDPRGANEGGFPWDPAFTSINPAYFEHADKKFARLVEAGLMPCIVGCWGFFLQFAGKEVIRRHWDYLLARYGAYPVVWCVAGEALMPFYTSEVWSRFWQDEAFRREVTADWRKSWAELTRHVKEHDAFGRLVTIHPIDYGREMLDDADELLDLEMLQTGHYSYNSLADTVNMIVKSVAHEPALPVINSEVCYEGNCNTNYADVQRFVFWTCMLSGACGHTYGANGIWQVNSRAVPYGPSPHGSSWGESGWEDAYQFPGSRQVGLGRRLLERYRWWAFKPQPEWLERHATAEKRFASYAAGIPGEVRVFFLSVLGNGAWGGIRVRRLAGGVRYRAYLYNPITGDDYDFGTIRPDEEGTWKSPTSPIVQDWILVIEETGDSGSLARSE